MAGCADSYKSNYVVQIIAVVLEYHLHRYPQNQSDQRVHLSLCRDEWYLTMAILLHWQSFEKLYNKISVSDRPLRRPRRRRYIQHAAGDGGLHIENRLPKSIYPYTSHTTLTHAASTHIHS